MNAFRKTMLMFAGLVFTCCGGGGGGPCEGVVCDDPPADTCKDEETLLRYEAEGTCNPGTGLCEYGYTEVQCEDGCYGGKCGEMRAVGYVALLEEKSSWEDHNTARAYFAEELHMLKTPFFYDARRMVEKHREGSCAYLESDGGGGAKLLMCDPPCGPDQYCDAVVCVDFPPHWNVGTIAVEGLEIQLSMESDQYDNYEEELAGERLFDEGSVVTVTASGGELEGFSVSATAVELLSVDSTVVDLIAGKPAVVSWTPQATDARMQVFLRTGMHRPRLPAAAILCDVPDGDGMVTIPASIVDSFRAAAGVNQQPCEIMRYNRSVQATPWGEVELTVGSIVGLQLNTP